MNCSDGVCFSFCMLCNIQFLQICSLFWSLTWSINFFGSWWLVGVKSVRSISYYVSVLRVTVFNDHILSIAYRWRKLLFAIRFWFKVDVCFTMALYTILYSNDGWHRLSLIELLSYDGWHRLSLIELVSYVSCRLNILCIKFKIIAFCIITLFARLYLYNSYCNGGQYQDLLHT